jgi:hypothetical protein
MRYDWDHRLVGWEDDDDDWSYSVRREWVVVTQYNE